MTQDPLCPDWWPSYESAEMNTAWWDGYNFAFIQDMRAPREKS